MSGTNRLINSTFQSGSESALTKGLMNANSIAKGKDIKKGKKESMKGATHVEVEEDEE